MEELETLDNAPLPRESPASSVHLSDRANPKIRELSRHACDGCRIRKVRCLPVVKPSELLLQQGGRSAATGPDGYAIEIESMTDSRLKCMRCSKLDLDCSFNLPVQRRGPKGSGRKLIENMDTQMQKSLSSNSGLTFPHNSGVSETMPQDPSSAEAASDMFSCPPGLAFHGHIHTDSAGSLEIHDQVESGHTSTIITQSSMDHESQRLASVQHGPCSDVLFPNELISNMVDDFFTYIYPILPLVHRQTFLKNFRENRHAHDANFFALVWAVCASTIAHHSEKLMIYQSAPTPLLIQSRLEVVQYCHIRSVQLRTPQYFDEVSHAKWATAYFFYSAFYQVGDVNKSRLLEMEAVLFARLLELHRISAYAGLNCIETQLRKKAFAIMMHGYVHYELQNIRKEKVFFIDCSTLHEIDLEELLPMPQDDEDITEIE